jgi:hypothetical protein
MSYFTARVKDIARALWAQSSGRAFDVNRMQYLVRMTLTAPSRSATPQEGVNLIELFILPTLEH